MKSTEHQNPLKSDVITVPQAVQEGTSNSQNVFGLKTTNLVVTGSNPVERTITFTNL